MLIDSGSMHLAPIPAARWPGSGRCEIWTRSAGIGATAMLSGYTCLRYLPNAGEPGVGIIAELESTSPGVEILALEECVPCFAFVPLTRRSLQRTLPARKGQRQSL